MFEYTCGPIVVFFVVGVVQRQMSLSIRGTNQKLDNCGSFFSIVLFDIRLE